MLAWKSKGEGRAVGDVPAGKSMNPLREPVGGIMGFHSSSKEGNADKTAFLGAPLRWRGLWTGPVPDATCPSRDFRDSWTGEIPLHRLMEQLPRPHSFATQAGFHCQEALIVTGSP